MCPARNDACVSGLSHPKSTGRGTSNCAKASLLRDDPRDVGTRMVR